MSQISSIFRDVQGGGLSFWCAGCRERHTIWTGEGPGPRWSFNGDLEKPVFHPSLLVTWDEPKNISDVDKLNADIAAKRAHGTPIPYVSKRCHSFIGCNGAQPGQIIYLNDSTHSLAGQTVDMVPAPGTTFP